MTEPCAHERDYTTAQAMKSYIDAATLAGDAAIERDNALAEVAMLRTSIANDIRAWSEARTAERVPLICEDADEGYCHHDAAFTAYALAVLIVERKLSVDSTP